MWPSWLVKDDTCCCILDHLEVWLHKLLTVNYDVITQSLLPPVCHQKQLCWCITVKHLQMKNCWLLIQIMLLLNRLATEHIPVMWARDALNSLCNLAKWFPEMFSRLAVSCRKSRPSRRPSSCGRSCCRRCCWTWKSWMSSRPPTRQQPGNEIFSAVACLFFSNGLWTASRWYNPAEAGWRNHRSSDFMERFWSIQVWKTGQHWIQMNQHPASCVHTEQRVWMQLQRRAGWVTSPGQRLCPAAPCLCTGC